MTLGPEAPAIVDLLVHGWGPTRAAPVATLLDLAARGHLHLVAEPSGRLICRLPSTVPSEPLAMFEQRLLRQVGGRLSGDSTPVAALLPDPEDELWNATFRSAVIAEARSLGLVRDRFPWAVRWGLRVSPALPASALGWWLVSLRDGGQLASLWSSLGGLLARLPDWVVGGLFITALSSVVLGLSTLFGVVGATTGGLQGTAVGRAAASRWLGARAALLTSSRPHRLPEAGASLGDRALAWAVALDAAPDVVAAVAPIGSDVVWSSAGGRWRQVRVSVRGPIQVRTFRRATLARRRTLTGRIVRRWTRKEPVETAEGTYMATRHYVAVDDGHSDEALAWAVRRGKYRRFTIDSTVRVTIDHKGRLIKITEAADSDSGGAVDQVPEATVADAWTRFDEYVAWYSWAALGMADDAIACHAAAAAATHALAAGGDHAAAAEAGGDAARDEAVIRRTRDDHGSRHSYIEWFIWARTTLGFPDERCHEAARAALRSIAAGGTQRSATEAVKMVATPPRPPDGRWWLVAGILLLVVAGGLAGLTVILVIDDVLIHDPTVDADTRLGAGIFLVLALLVGAVGDLLIVRGFHPSRSSATAGRHT